MFCCIVHAVWRDQGKDDLDARRRGQPPVYCIENHTHGQADDDTHHHDKYKTDHSFLQKKLAGQDRCQRKPEYNEGGRIIEQALPFGYAKQ